MTDKNEWWLKKFNEKNWGACFECCDYEGMVDDIRGILAEHTRRIVEAVEGMKKERYWCGEDPETEEMREMEADEPCAWGGDMSFAFNSALDEAIKKISQLSA